MPPAIHASPSPAGTRLSGHSLAAGGPPDRPGPIILLEAVDIVLERGGRTILDRISLRVQAGEVVVVIGPNGAGKTSLLRVMLGLWQPNRGRVVRAPGLRIGYMPQRIQVDPILPLTVRRFLTLRHRAPLAELRTCLEAVGVAPLLNAPIQTLSGGEMQRVLLARALLAKPDLLVLDEPDQGVDVVGQGEVFELIDRLRQETGCGVLMVSHELHLVMAAADHVVCIHQHVCCTGHPEEVSRNPEYLRLFPEASTRAIGIYTHRHNHVHGLAGEVHPMARGVGASGGMTGATEHTGCAHDHHHSVPDSVQHREPGRIKAATHESVAAPEAADGSADRSPPTRGKDPDGDHNAR